MFLTQLRHSSALQQRRRNPKTLDAIQDRGEQPTGHHRFGHLKRYIRLAAGRQLLSTSFQELAAFALERPDLRQVTFLKCWPVKELRRTTWEAGILPPNYASIGGILLPPIDESKLKRDRIRRLPFVLGHEMNVSLRRTSIKMPHKRSDLIPSLSLSH